MVKVFIGLLFIILLGHSYHLRPLIFGNKRGVGLSSSSPGRTSLLANKEAIPYPGYGKKKVTKEKSKERAYDILESGRSRSRRGGGEE